MISILNEATNDVYSLSTGNPERRYLDDALQAIDTTDSFALLNGEYGR